MTERRGVSGVWIGVVCVAAIVASAVAWSAVRRAERMELRAADLENTIRDKDARIAALQAGDAGESETSRE